MSGLYGNTFANTATTAGEDWRDNDLAPIPDNLPQIQGWNILVRPVPFESKTKGGILLADSTLDDANSISNVCKVVSVGPLAYKETEHFGETPWCKEGDYIIIGRHAGLKFEFHGCKLIMIKEPDVLMTVKSPKDVSSNYVEI